MENFFITKLFTTPELLDKYTKKAKDYFMGGVYGSEGAEQERYLKIIMEIESGKTDIDSDSPTF